MSFSELLQVNRQRQQPLYQQIAEQIRVQIGAGRLPAGTQLPTVRQLAGMLGVTRVTAQNAYSELQSGGWVESTVGRGTFVSAASQIEELQIALQQPITADGVIGNMQRLDQIAGLRSFAHSEPDPALFPLDDFRYALTSQFDRLAELMQYGSPQGDPLLRVELAAMLTEQGIGCVPDEVLVTTGASQGLTLLTMALAGRGTCVAVDQPVYLGLLHLLNVTGAEPIGVPWDSEGPRLDVLERVIIERQPRFFYTTANFQNPTGACISPQRQLDVLALAERYRLYILEDDSYGQLAYSDVRRLPLKASDRNNRVIYLSSFSKTLMTGLRIGYMVMPPELRERLLVLRQAIELSGVALIQRATATFIHRGRFKAHLRRVLPRYRERRDALMSALQRHMPFGVEWTKPEGGFCCWVTLPPGRSTGQYADLYHTALRHGMAFTPGDVFLIEPDGATHLRLCFGKHTPEQIDEGIAVLGHLLHGNRVGRLRGIAHDWPLV
ncbi:MAG: MocR-like pyridoxine biosynthesis transcription factor PdxR [Aggregatilineales bacterium]